MVTNDDKGNYYSKELSHDHKPDSPGEKERILSKGGVIAP